VGVEPGAAAGVPNFDHASLGQKMKTYADGPRWTPHYVEFNGVTVLVVVVEAPRAGDPIHTLQKEFTKDKTSHKAGTVFHRGAAHTEPAGPKEMAMLQERLLQGAQQPDLSLDLVASADPLIRLEANKAQVQNWLQRHEAFVRANSGQPPPPPPKPPSSSPAFPYTGLSNFDFGVRIGNVLGNFQNAKPEDSEEFERRVKERPPPVALQSHGDPGYGKMPARYAHTNRSLPESRGRYISGASKSSTKLIARFLSLA
jgi:hypothetical protein